MEKTWDITEFSALEAAAAEILEMAKESSAEIATVLALHGDLGAGKTTFVQAIAKKLGIEEKVTSPTFVIAKSYTTQSPRFKKLLHIDAYRLESVDEMRVLRFSQELEQKDTIICIEWAEKTATLLPAHIIHLQFSLTQTARTLVIKR